MPVPRFRLRPTAAGALASLLLAASLAASSRAAEAPDANRMQMEVQPNFARMQAVGKAMFFDQSLSASGRMACASCHDPAHAYGPPNALSVQPGGKDGRLAGSRAVPSLRYQQNVPPFTAHHFDDDFDESVDQGPAGGHGWDGRFRTLHEQAGVPLLAVNEMANASPAAVVAKIRRAPYAAQFRDTFGATALDDDARAFQWATLALEMFQQDPKEFYPYNSRYDAYLRKEAPLSAPEMRGLALFNDEKKGNCASCHVSQVAPNSGAFPAFSDFGFIALGVPRNRTIAANRNPAFYDMGLCGPERTDFKDPATCGAFRTSSLRNVATRQAFFHNGIFHSLEEVIRFYISRDTEPARWYPYPARAGGKHAAFDDLPARYAGNVNTDPPFGSTPGGKPRLNEAEIRDMVAFLRTLTDKDVEATAARLAGTTTAAAAAPPGNRRLAR